MRISIATLVLPSLLVLGCMSAQRAYVRVGVEGLSHADFGPPPGDPAVQALHWARKASSNLHRDKIEVTVGELQTGWLPEPLRQDNGVYGWYAQVDATGGSFASYATPPWKMWFKDGQLVAVGMRSGQTQRLDEAGQQRVADSMREEAEQKALMEEVQRRVDTGDFGEFLWRDRVTEALETGDAEVVRDAVRKAEEGMELVREAEQRQSEADCYFEEHPDRAAYEEPVHTRRIEVGMNTEEVRLVLGEPTHVEEAVLAHRVEERWIYDAMVCHFDDGVLTAWED